MNVYFAFDKGFFRHIVDGLPTPITIREAGNYKIAYCNEEFAKLAGKTKEELIGKKEQELFDSEVARKLIDLDGKVQKSKSVEAELIEFKLKSNIVEIYDVKKYPHFSSNSNEVDYIISVYQKVTRELAADEILRETELLYLKIFESIPVGIVLLKEEGLAIFEANPRFLQMLNLELEQILYKSFFELPFSVPNEKLKEYFELAKEQNHLQFDVFYEAPDGLATEVVLDVVYIKFMHQEPWYLVIASDVSALQEANREIFTIIRREQELNILKNRFISLISHELRTPLSGIMLSVDLLERYSTKLSEEEKSKHFERIRTSIQTIIRTIENAMQLEKLTEGDYPLQLKKIYLKNFIEELAGKIQTFYNYKNPVVINIKDDIEIETDEVLFSLILNNLLSNAFKYSPFDMPITVSSDLHGDTLYLQIQNFGEPIPDNEKVKLFEPFFRGSNTKNAKGFGLGLTVVKKAVEYLKGSINLQSSSETGTIFSIILPLQRTEVNIQ